MMPDGTYSIDYLLRFLKYAGMEGLINPAAARSRRNAAQQLSSELTEAERKDLRLVNVDELASRFHKLEESSIRSEALDLFADRLKMALTDFFAWMEDPASFSSVGSERQRAIKRLPNGGSAISRDQEAAEQIALEATENPSNIVPIPIRDQQVVYVANLPVDLSRDEADRIAKVVRAYVNSSEPAKGTEQPS